MGGASEMTAELAMSEKVGVFETKAETLMPATTEASAKTMACCSGTSRRIL
jgi:hypothetical protein